jgi:hypothetical protein
VAVVGAILQSCPSPPDGFSCGAAFVFRRVGGVWSLETTLRSDLISDNNFGGSIQVSRDGTTVLVRGDVYGGANAGTIYVFREAGGTWSLETKIPPPVPTLLAFSPAALSGDGQTGVAAAIPLGGGIPPTQLLSYYVYVRNAGVWTQQGPALPPAFGNGSAGLSFDGNTAILGLESGGKAQLFARSGGTWSLLQELTPAEPGAAASSTVVALSGDARTALVGLPEVDCVGGCRGAAFIFAEDVPLAAVPTLSELGLALLALLIAGTGAVLVRRRRTA